jgi:hypothetical protein
MSRQSVFGHDVHPFAVSAAVAPPLESTRRQTIIHDIQHPNAPRDDAFGGLGTNRPTIAPQFAAPPVGRVVLNAPLTSGNTAIQLLLALENYRSENRIFPRIAVVMPDHIHFIATFSQHSDMATVIRNWKRWTARKIGIVWQDGFFDHRLRNDAELAEKMAYIANNPVRKCLCAIPDDWPFRMNW